MPSAYQVLWKDGEVNSNLSSIGGQSVPGLSSSPRRQWHQDTPSDEDEDYERMLLHMQGAGFLPPGLTVLCC